MILVLATKLATTTLVGLPPYSVPVPFVAVNVMPAVKPKVLSVPVIVAVNGPLPEIDPMVHVPVEIVILAVETAIPAEPPMASHVV